MYNVYLDPPALLIQIWWYENFPPESGLYNFDKWE